MHTWVVRINALGAFAVTALALLCALTSASDHLLPHRPAPDVHLQLANVERLQLDEMGNEEAYLAINLRANLSSLFGWNVKMVLLWDARILRKEDADLQLPYQRPKYKLVDQGRNLRGRNVTLVLSWNVIPVTGRLRYGQHRGPNITLPSTYK
eukprot:jgi/Chlat1/2532/Chrsp175S02433